jgi:hypothetical protein
MCTPREPIRLGTDVTCWGREIDWYRASKGGSDKCGGIPMDSLITAAARVADDRPGALRPVALRAAAQALALCRRRESAGKGHCGSSLSSLQGITHDEGALRPCVSELR